MLGEYSTPHVCEPDQSWLEAAGRQAAACLCCMYNAYKWTALATSLYSLTQEVSSTEKKATQL